jgi:hypothetical protein
VIGKMLPKRKGVPMASVLQRIAFGLAIFFSTTLAFSENLRLHKTTSESNPSPRLAKEDEKEVKKFLWKTAIGSSSGTPVIYKDKVILGTNNNTPLDPKMKGDRGIVACFDKNTGAFLWQATHARLDHRANDLPQQGICSLPCVENDRVYYFSNRGELVCLNINGMSGGAFQKEKPPESKNALLMLNFRTLSWTDEQI